MAATSPEVRSAPVDSARISLTFFAGYGSLIRAYVTLILAKLKFHRLHPDFNGLFEYEEYISLRGVDDPNEGCASSFSVHVLT